MSFLGGGAECSTAGNPLSQFTKHVQDDKSLQRDRLVGRGPGGLQEGMRSQQMGGGSDAVRIPCFFVKKSKTFLSELPLQRNFG
jgi:peroxin-5